VAKLGGLTAVELGINPVTEMREIVLDAWRMVVPKRVAATYAE